MTAIQVLFWIVAAVTLLAALMVVTRRNLVHAALFLVLTLLGVAVFFVLLEAGFLAVVQIVIYIGAIAILMIFAVMLTRKVASDDLPAFNANLGISGMIGVLVFSGLFLALNQWPLFTAQAPAVDLSQTTSDLGFAMASAEGFVVPFLIASVLLLGALIGSIVIAWPQQGKE